MDDATVKDVSRWSNRRCAEWLEAHGTIHPTVAKMTRWGHDQLVNDVLERMDSETAAVEQLRVRLGDAIIAEAAATNNTRAAVR